MCTFIAAMLPPSAQAAEFRALADVCGLAWKPLMNRYLLAQVTAGSLWFLTNRKHCNCGTALGAATRSDEVSFHNPESEIPKLQKKGWSEAKIERWLGDKSATVARRQKEAVERAAEKGAELESWLRFLRAALESDSSDRVGVLLHEYSGLVDGERVAIKGRKAVEGANMTSELLRGMESDVLYEFRR
jgi:hypothetical protein